jgi:hypothetical protein
MQHLRNEGKRNQRFRRESKNRLGPKRPRQLRLFEKNRIWYNNFVSTSDGTERLRVKIVVRPSPSDDSKLTVEDAMRQVLDAIEVLNAARAHASGGEDDLFVWKLESASANSPFTIEAFADPVRPGVNVDSLVERTKAFANETLVGAIHGDSPIWINRDAAGALSRIAARSMNGIASTLFDFYELPPVEITKDVAPRLLQAIQASDPFIQLDTPKRVAFGDIDGRLIAVGTHYRAPALFLLNPLYGRVTCTIPKDIVEALGGEATLSDVWQGKPVVVTGKLNYAPGGKLTSVVVHELRERKVTHVLLDEVIDADFTDGLEPPEYLDKLHEGELG